MANGERWERRINNIQLTLTRRGLELHRDDGAQLILSMWPAGWNLAWNIGQQCRCGSGRLQRLTLDANRVILSCDGCSHAIPYYADVSMAEAQRQQVR